MNKEERIKALTATAELVKSGFAGVLGNGNIVDRRRYPHAIPMQENKMMGVPSPVKVEEIDCPNCYSGHQRPCQWCGDTGRVVNIPNADS